MSTHTFQHFLLYETPLQSGVTLLEASAGTGKTFTLVGLILRWIVERGIPVEQLLVTTFTKAATAELRARTRAVLVDALKQTEADSWTGDLEPYAPVWQSIPREDRYERLEAAVRQFDQLLICTIHGFCQRLLAEWSLEIGSDFRPEVEESGEELIHAMVRDAWRKVATSESTLTIAALVHAKAEPLLKKSLQRFLMTGRPRVIERVEAFHSATATLEEFVENDDPGLRECAPLPKRSGRSVQTLIDVVRKFVTTEDRTVADYTELFNAWDEAAEYTVKYPEVAPLHAWGTKLQNARDSVVDAFVAEFLTTAPTAHNRRKAAAGTIDFDDLLRLADNALAVESGAALAAQIRKRFRVAFVDEFQDTDPMQYRILRRLFAEFPNALYLIGDPKQAIYRFRGADLQTYLAAADAAENAYALGVNYRSAEALVSAVNTLFGTGPNAFHDLRIIYRPVSAGPKAGRQVLAWQEKERPPFRIADVPSGGQAAIPAAVAAQVRDFLEGRPVLDGAILGPSDLAILVASNEQVTAMERALVQLGIPAVALINQSVFQSRECEELLILLRSWLHPGNEGAVRAAMLLPVFNLFPEAFDPQGTITPSLAETTMDRCYRLGETWKTRGLRNAWNLFALDPDQAVRAQLLSLFGGERRWVNYEHLIELLHRAESKEALNPPELWEWLQASHLSPPEGEESAVQRAASEGGGVAVMTVHKSKGLEFPVVWCPYVRDSETPPRRRRESERYAVYHDAEKGERVMEIPATDSGQRKESEEERHEQARLTYVAFTRAKAECHVFRKTARNSKETVGGVEDCGVILPNPADIAESNRLFGRETVPDNLVRRWNAPEPVAPNTRALRTFRTVIPNDFGIRSFSALAAGSDEHGAVLRTIPTEDEPLEGMAAFPRGPHAGTALHSLLETVDFANPASFQTEIESVFVRHALPMRHSGAVQDLLMHLGAWEPEPGVPLNTIPRKQIRTECRFTLRLTHPDRTRFQELQIDETRYDIETGFLVGSIDVLIAYKGRYHIIDWKSNWLGPTPDAYTEEAIAAEMLYHNYHLQYKIYAVALRKYLLSRGLKVNDCKEIRIHYLFLRAARRGRFPLFSATATKEALDIWELALIGRG